ncbi:MAG: hypothetical protein HQM10_22560 [Candidatus Riflebacteria bacterium]|nr:hypothetical protein [Candidatus Riflebacteria bacterium]
MRAYILETETRIEPFGDHVSETLITDQPFGQMMKDKLSAITKQVTVVPLKSDLQKVVSDKALVISDNVFTTERLLKEFIKKAEELPGSAVFQLRVKKGLFTRLLAPIQDLPQTETSIDFPVWYFTAEPGKKFLPENASKIEIDVDEDSYEGGFPKHMLGKESYKFCLTSRPVVHVTNALHLALTNISANFARLAEIKKASVLRKLFILLKARSINKFRILRAASQIHPEAEVHPTAVIEGSVIGKGAKIGAYAVIKFSIIGEKAFIDDHAGIKFSVIGRESYIANNCVMFFSVVYPRAFLISGPFQFSLFGYDTALMNAIPADYRLDGQTVSVRTGKGVCDTGLRFCGSVIGHRTKIAAGVIIAPGRQIPNDLLIFPDPSRVIQKTPDADSCKGQTMFLIDGKLVPGSELKNKGTTK